MTGVQEERGKGGESCVARVEGVGEGGVAGGEEEGEEEGGGEGVDEADDGEEVGGLGQGEGG